MFLAGCAMYFSAAAQKYCVSGQVPAGATDIRTVYLYNLESRTPDSVAVAGGRFSFEGEADGKIFAFVSPDGGKHRVPVVLDGDVTVNIEENTASGTAENEGLTRWNAGYSAAIERMNNLLKEYNAYREKGNVPDSVEQRISSSYDKTLENLSNDIKTCCAENATAKFPAYFLASMAGQMEKEDVLAIAETEPAFLQISLLGRLRGNIVGWKRQARGEMFTDFAMPDTTGTERRLSDFVGNGKYVLVDFWASWCGPCRQEMPHVKAAYEKYHDRGFDIVGVSFDNNKTAWTAAIRKMELPWHHLSDLKGWQSVAAAVYGINSIPATLLIGPDGKVLASGLRGEKLTETLEEIFR